MARKQAGSQQGAGNAGLDITLQSIMSGVEDALLVIDEGYHIRFANSAAGGRLDKKAGWLIGRLCYETLYGRDNPCSFPLWECPLRKVIRDGSTTTVVHPARIRGADTYLKFTAYPLRDSHGKTKAIVELLRDVTAEKALESDILKRHHQLLALSHISGAMTGLQDLNDILSVALDNVLEMINGTIGGILLQDEENEKLYYHIHRGLSDRYAREMRLSIGEGIAGRVAQTGEPILLEDVSVDTRTFHLDLVSTEGIKGFVSIPLKGKNAVVGVMNVASHEAGRFGEDDVYLLSSIGEYLGTAIEQARLYEQLAEARERYRALLQHALNAQEEERRRIARELHDETTQAITSLTLSLQAMTEMAEMKDIGDDEFVERLKKTHSYAVHAGNEIVKLMKELRPTLLDELGLPAAIYRYAMDTLKAKGITVSIEFKGTDERLPPKIEVTLFRITQGLVGNILEHSEAKKASIKLECNTGECTLRIEDDGKGFDVNKLTRVESSGRGAGLFTVKERVSLLDGTCHIDSQPGKGTRVTMQIPLVKDKADEESKGADS